MALPQGPRNLGVSIPTLCRAEASALSGIAPGIVRPMLAGELAASCLADWGVYVRDQRTGRRDPDLDYEGNG
jgi:hypothetical protein